jgi:hypothetical protein
MRVFFKRKESPDVLTRFWRSRFWFPSSVSSYLRVSLRWFGCCASGRFIWCARVWVSGWGTVIRRPASRGFWFQVHPVLTANLVLGSSLGCREFDLRASGKRAAWPCHVLKVSAEEKNRTYNIGLNSFEIGIWMFPNLIQLMSKNRQLLPERALGSLKRGTLRTCC